MGALRTTEIGSRTESGSATAELVVLLPLLSVVIWLASAIGSAQLGQLQNETAAAALVRALQLGHSNAELDAIASRVGVHYKQENLGDGLICIAAGSNSPVSLFVSVTWQRSCGVVPAQ